MGRNAMTSIKISLGMREIMDVMETTTTSIAAAAEAVGGDCAVRNTSLLNSSHVGPPCCTTCVVSAAASDVNDERTDNITSSLVVRSVVELGGTSAASCVIGSVDDTVVVVVAVAVFIVVAAVAHFERSLSPMNLLNLAKFVLKNCRPDPAIVLLLRFALRFVAVYEHIHKIGGFRMSVSRDAHSAHMSHPVAGAAARHVLTEQ
jgi:hypothetical protein